MIVTSETTFEEFSARWRVPGIDDAQLRHFYDIEIEAARYAESVAMSACPEWCNLEPGHDYDSASPEDHMVGRYHAFEPRGGKSGAWLTAFEENRGGVVTFERVRLICEPSHADDLDFESAVEVATDLLAAARKLAEIATVTV